MGLVEIFCPNHDSSKLRKFILYLLDKVVIAVIVALIVFGFQHYAEQQDAVFQAKSLREEKIAQVISEYSTEMMDMSSRLSRVDRPLSTDSLESDYHKARSAIDSLLIERELNYKAFLPYSDEIDACKKSINDYCNFIREAQRGEFGAEGTLEEYSNALGEHHRAIQASCITLSNHCSDVIYDLD